MGWKESEKLYFLKLVNEKKAVLFGKFMDTLTRDDKKNEWITIINKCRHNGFELVPISISILVLVPILVPISISITDIESIPNRYRYRTEPISIPIPNRYRMPIPISILVPISISPRRSIIIATWPSWSRNRDWFCWGNKSKFARGRYRRGIYGRNLRRLRSRWISSGTQSLSESELMNISSAKNQIFPSLLTNFRDLPTVLTYFRTLLPFFFSSAHFPATRLPFCPKSSPKTCPEFTTESGLLKIQDS